jgi:hypothetical protein
VGVDFYLPWSAGTSGKILFEEYVTNEMAVVFGWLRREQQMEGDVCNLSCRIGLLCMHTL